MKASRRGFLGALTALMAAPWAPKRAFDWYRDPIPLPPDAVVFRGVTLVPDVVPEVFHGSFKIGEITRKAALSREARARVEACTRELEEWDPYARK